MNGAEGNTQELYEALLRARLENSNLLDALRVEREPDPRSAYSRWLESRKFSSRDLERLRVLSGALALRPKFSVIVATYETREAHLRAALDSVFAQTYDNWELCIADDASQQPHVRRILQEYSTRGPRIKTVFRTENGHISRATNSALALAEGDFVCLLDHDDVLTPDALFEVALLTNMFPDADFIYSDEDKLDDATGEFVDPYFKPDWCPDSLLSRMYTAHLGVYRRTLVEELGGMREGFEGSQDHDLVLRLVERTNRIHHIPKVLYHWRIHANSTASEMQAKPYAIEAGARAIGEAIARRGQPGAVLAVPECPGAYIVRYQIGHSGRVQILLSARSDGAGLDRCLASIFAHDAYSDFEILLLHDAAGSELLETCLRWSSGDPRVRIVNETTSVNPARLRNALVAERPAPYVLFLDGDTEVVSHDWLGAFVEQAQRPTIGAVGPLLLDPDGTIRQAGLIVGTNHVVVSGHRSFPADAFGYFSTLRSINNFSAVSGVCMMVRREAFLRSGALDEQLSMAYGDVDLCLRLRRAGFDNVFLPHVVLYQHGLGDPNESSKRAGPELELMQTRWRAADLEDPCYNPNLALDEGAYALRV